MQDYIIIGFSTHIKFSAFSELIKLFDKTKFSHVYIRWNSSTINRQLTYQASGLAVNFCGKEVFYSKNKDIAQFIIPVTHEEKLEIIQTAVDLAGKPYGIKDILGITLVRLASFFGKKIKNPFADGSTTYICSELAATILIKVGFKFEDLDSVTPKDVYDKLRGYYGSTCSTKNS